MTIQFHKRILFAITIWVVLASMIPLLINAIHSYFSSKNELVKELHTTADITAHQLAKSVVTPLWNMDDASVMDLIQSRFQQSEVLAIIIKNPTDSSVIYGMERDTAWAPVVCKNVRGGDAIASSAPVEKDGKVQGIVTVYLSDKFTKKQLKTLTANLTVSTFILAIVLILVLFFCIHYIVVKPINCVVTGLRDISEGDGNLTKRLEIMAENEIGALSHYFNNFIMSLQEMIASISAKSTTVKSSSGELTSLSNEIREEGISVSSRADSITAISNDMSARMLAIIQAMEDARKSVSSVSISIEELTATINEISKNAEKSSATTETAVQFAQNAGIQIENLKNAALDIGKVTQTIADISDQTNLLALNATIEAASAGEAGKGFTVVASEIKALSKKTVAATQDIINRVDKIRSATTEMIEFTNSISSVITDINSYVRSIAAAIVQQSATANEIHKTSSGVLETMKTATISVSEASKQYDGIAKEFVNVTASAGVLSEKNNSVFMNAESLRELAVLLNDLVSRFKV